jgi:hypothetical protein
MDQERTDAQPEQADSELLKMRSCILEGSNEGVRFVVDGHVAKVVSFDTYEVFYKNLTRGLEFNIFPLETADQAEIKVQLPPLSEIRAGAVELRSLDGVTYGRRYKLVEVKKEADGTSYAVVALADTGEVVEREPWEDFKRRVIFDRCRSGSAYRAMAGEFNPRLYFDITGQIYNPKEGKPEAAEKRAAEGEREAEVEGPRGEDPLLRIVAAGMVWLRRNPRYIYIGSAIILLAAAFSIAGVWYRARFLKAKPAVMSAAQLNYHLNLEFEVTQALSAGDFVKYARDHPRVAKESVENLAAFVEKNRNTPGLSAEQTRKFLFISSALPRLQAQLAKAAEQQDSGTLPASSGF